MSDSDDENHVKTPSTRTLSREKSPEEAAENSANSLEKSQTSFKNPTYPLEARKSFEGGMTNSAILRHVSMAIVFFHNGVKLFLNSDFNFLCFLGFHESPLFYKFCPQH